MTTEPPGSSSRLDGSAKDDLIGSATSVEDIIASLAKHGCPNLTSSIDSAACSVFPCAGGGFCDVYQGALYNGAKVALKVLRVYDRPGGENDRQKILKRAAREMYHWSKLQHSNVLPLMGLAIFREQLSMLSYWMENGSLMSYLRLNPDANRVKLCIDICEGLSYIHANDMVHGDLKAANIMVSSDEAALIADFGNAQLKDLTLKFTSTTKAGLSVRWAAPELLLEDNGPQMSKEADVYAYGMTALEALTGKVPYEGISDTRVLCLVAYERKIPSRPADMSNDLWGILNSCWTHNASERPRITTVTSHLRALFLAYDVAQQQTSQRLDIMPNTVSEKLGIANQAPMIEAKPSSSQVIDLHGLTLGEAIGVVKRGANIWWSSPGATPNAPLEIITGKGAAPTIKDHLERDGWHAYQREGSVYVTGIAARDGVFAH